MLHLEKQVGPVKTGGDLQRRNKAQHGADVVLDARGGRGRERAHGHARGQLGHKLRDALITAIRISIKSCPHWDTQCASSTHTSEICALRAKCAKPGVSRRSGAAYTILYTPRAALSSALRHCASVSELLMYARAHAHLHKRLHLVAHQRDQRRDHHRHARQKQRRQLIADGFARARGHHGQRVAALQQTPGDLVLARAEIVVAEHVFQRGAHSVFPSGCISRTSSFRKKAGAKRTLPGMVGLADSNQRNDGVKVRCLTTWAIAQYEKTANLPGLPPFFVWGGRWDSNPRHPDPQSGALTN